MLDGSSRRRVRQLTRKLLGTPTLPLLGWTKAVESLITAPETIPWWVGYSVVVTALWVFADDIRDAAEEAVEDVAE